MLNVGLTGSIAVGKTFVCGVFRELGCHVLDADITAREVVEPGTPGLRRIIDTFGPDVLQPDGELDRQRLGALVFSDRSKREALNSILHPLIIERQNNWIEGIRKKDPDGIVIVDAALMIESGGYKRFDQLIVVWCKPRVQLERLMQRDGISKEDAAKRIASQMPQDEKKRYADHLIDTSEGFGTTRLQVTEVFKKLKSRG